MVAIVGLGNPGREYENTPHNLGFLTIDRLAQEYGLTVRRPECNSLVGRGKIESCDVLLSKPLSFMNGSGGPVRALLEKYQLRIEDLMVISDDFNLPWMSLRIRQRGSSGGHLGLESIIQALDSRVFLRVRLGVAPEERVRDGAAFVLAPFRRARQKQLEELLSRAVEAVRMILAEGAAKAMTRYNRRAGSPKTEGE